MSFVARGHPSQVSHDPAVDRLFDLPPQTYDVDDRETDEALFTVLDDKYRFTIDVAAASHNAKCKRYWTAEDDGLAQSWAGERVWCNPPYTNIRRWVEKAHAEWADDAELIVMLLPANRTEQSWWQDLVEPRRDGRGPIHTDFIPGRPRFTGPGAGRTGRPPFGCVVLRW